MKRPVAELACEAVSTSDFKEFGEALALQTLPESFGILADLTLNQAIAEQLAGASATDWVVSPITWNVELYDPRAEFKPAEQFLHLLWQDLSSRLVRKIDAVARRTSITSRGAVLCFFGRAELCVVVEYRRSPGGAINLRPLVACLQPNAVTELSSMLVGAAPNVRNAIKQVAFSVDKLVYQRGAITHVNRQAGDVFGPTIDTIVLGELVAEWLSAQPSDQSISALEIGPGSGFLSTIIGTCPNVRELTAIELNEAAATCTLKNLLVNELTLDAKNQWIRVRAERFAANQFTKPFDLIVCNPPYIPDAPKHGASEYGRAVGGLELCTEVLQSLPDLLTDEGALLLMVSSLSKHLVVAAIPEGFELTTALPEGGRKVPLDVDVVWDNAEWLKKLLSDGHLTSDADGNLWHQLLPIWVRRSMGGAT